MTMNITELELRELEIYINDLTGIEWLALARSQYLLSRQKEMSHKDAMTSVTDKIIEVATKVIEKDE